MKKTKRFLGLLLILGMMSSFVAVAYAEENSTETAPSGLKVLSPAENDEYFNSLNQDEQEKIKEKSRVQKTLQKSSGVRLGQQQQQKFLYREHSTFTSRHKVTTALQPLQKVLCNILRDHLIAKVL